MPSIYLSPSLQEYNPYIIGGNEEMFMNLIADAMVPYLRANQINFTRNNPGMTLSQIIAESNAGDYDVHLALHSNTAPDHLAGVLQGPDVYYYTYSIPGQTLAGIIADNFREIYPDPSLVAVIPNTTLAELRRTEAVTVLVEIAYHDNFQDASWIADNIWTIARALVLSLTEYFDLPFVDLPEENIPQ